LLFIPFLNKSENLPESAVPAVPLRIISLHAPIKMAVSTRKCPACGQWSNWSQNPDDKCEHCGSILDPQGLRARQLQEEEALRQKKNLNIALIEIYPYDSSLTRFGKRIVQGFQLTLMGIISFIIWVVTVLAG